MELGKKWLNHWAQLEWDFIHLAHIILPRVGLMGTDERSSWAYNVGRDRKLVVVFLVEAAVPQPYSWEDDVWSGFKKKNP